MKKIPYSLLPFFFVTLFAVGCAKEDEATNDVTPYTINIKVGETYDLGEIGPWSAWNPFVATAWHNGKVTGQHVGECTVNCPYDERQFKFLVSANINLFKDPITTWGVSKSYVISKEGSGYQTNGELITWARQDSVSPYIAYSLENGELTSATIFVYSQYMEQAYNHLSERYKFVYYEDGKSTFINANNMNNATTIVTLKLYTSTICGRNCTYCGIVYMKNT